MKDSLLFSSPHFSLKWAAFSLISVFALAGCESLPEVFSDDDVNVGDGDGDMGGAPGDGDGIVIGTGGGDGDGDGDGDGGDFICGNGELEPGELCDDGGTDDDDGCSGDCLNQDPDFDCSNAGEACVNTVVCGNGVLEGDEACDEGDENATEGCAEDCSAITEGWSCPRPAKSCVALPVCGNGLRERGEQCDDAQDPPEDGDGCSEVCLEEDPDNYFCVPGEACVALSCGDGVRTPDEACDDGNSADDDGCSTCVVDEGFRCSTSGCSAVCGDGLIRGGEECDDENRASADGCSAACIEEPYQACTGEPSDCVSTIVCGNNVVEPGEVCDPPANEVPTTTCVLPGDPAGIPCQQFDTGKVDLAICNGIAIELGEECDGDGGTGGCDADCEIEDGYACPAADYCYLVPACGDGVLQAGEQCDEGALSSNACDNCVIQPDWYCSGSPSVCVPSLCGDGEVAPDEQCDDGDGAGDGCDSSCEVEEEWVCPPGIDCIPVCGNNLLQGMEQCDVASPGCVNCRVQLGYDCGDDGVSDCNLTLCGNGTPADTTLAAAIAAAERGEGCDDGNTIAGDGCGPTCQLEPSISRGPSPVVAVTCGDGIKTGTEGCDDGNTTDDDGCSSGCLIEHGWYCDEDLVLPPEVEMRVLVRDFKAGNANSGGGHPDFQYQTLNHVPGVAGIPCDAAEPDACGRLDDAGKPFLHVDNRATTGIRDQDTFGLWFRDSNPDGVETELEARGAAFTGPISVLPPFQKTITLGQVGGTDSETYTFNPTGAQFFPLDGGDAANSEGFGALGYEVDRCDTGGGTNNGVRNVNNTNMGNPSCMGCGGPRGTATTCQGRNFSFTTEMRYFFQYQGGESLLFRGDDDVWVFINGRLAVDIGGLHPVRFGRVVLGDDGDGGSDDSDCSVHSETNEPAPCPLEAGELEADNIIDDKRFGLDRGGVYEIVLFHAERHSDASNFQLTLAGFIPPRSFCETDCGDDIRAGNELCDGTDVPASAHNGCVPDGQPGECTFEFCGDNEPNGAEACDNGLNIDTYDDGSGGSDLCAPGCVLPGDCGDNILQPSNEVCDDGVNDGGYGECDSCTSISYCGDGEITDSEVCEKDDENQSGTANTGESFVNYRDGLNDCGFNCQLAPFCGDNVRNGEEHCERFVGGIEDVYCDAATCTYEPYCGDGLVDANNNEQCDYGVDFGFDGDPEDAPFGGCTLSCELGPFCGDGSQHEFEECDFGTASNDGEYDGCTDTCTLGPRCGDAELQNTQGEECDNGFNDDTYAYVDDACGPACTDVPYCGDGNLQATFELCDAGDDNDDATYDGCTTVCDWGPYCGDGTVQSAFETCDLGIDNASYSASGEGCGYDCQPAPYCGDGERNGPEQCDRGTAGNDGEYGSCKANCTNAPSCGDGIVQSGEGEHCDAGPTGSLTCSVTCRNRDVIK